jgi:hypothetical protein
MIKWLLIKVKDNYTDGNFNYSVGEVALRVVKI